MSVLLGAILLFACSSDTQPKTDVAGPGHTHEEATTGLLLNEGKKWHSDSATNENVKRLQSIATQFANDGLTDYKALGVSLQGGLDKLIRDCRMKGKDHEALHQWLEPFAKAVAELSIATEVDQARNTWQQIRADLEKYQEYFE